MQGIDLTPNEWYVMECLWQKGQCTGREAVEHLQLTVGWSRSTTLTMLRRMTEKGMIACKEENGLLVYSPLIDRTRPPVGKQRAFWSGCIKVASACC